jgi:all-trans-retinol 13,14-reductase
MKYPAYPSCFTNPATSGTFAGSWDAIVIGSGIGGLATAALLSRFAHKKVLVLERHYTAGGYTHVFQRKGYEWDVGLHYVGQVRNESSQARKAFDLITNGQLEWSSMPDVYDRFAIAGRQYEFVSSPDRFAAKLKTYFPTESTAIDGYLKAVQAAARAGELYFAEKAIPRPLAFLFGGLMRAPFMRWAQRTTAEVLTGFTKNQELIGLLTGQWGDYGLPPGQSSFAMHAIIANHYLDGASYPVGGAARIAETILPVIEESGGKIVINAEVAEVMVKNGRATGVRMADGNELRAPVVISDAGARNTFSRLLPTDGRKHQVVTDQIRTIPPSTAHVCLYVGLKDTAANLGLAGTNIWVYPGPNHDANLEKFLSDPRADLPAVYISFPSAKDPDFDRRHPNRATVEVITFTPYRWFEKWQETGWRRRGSDYDAFKEELASRLSAELIRQVPALDGKIDYAELSTPLSTRHFMNHQQGEMYGLSSTPERFRLRRLTPKTSIRQLYLTGQDVSCLGVTGALFGGFLTASAILGRNLIGELGKRGVRQKPSAGPPKASVREIVAAKTEPLNLAWRQLIAHYA